MTLYAQWTINSYSVTYDANGGTGTQTDPNSPYNFGATVTVLGTGTITRTGYTFSHWNTAADNSGTNYNPTDMFAMPAANVTLYAQWTINTYTVTYDANGGTGSQTDPNSPYNYNSTVTVLGTGTLDANGLHLLALEHGSRWQRHELQSGGYLQHHGQRDAVCAVDDQHLYGDLRRQRRHRHARPIRTVRTTTTRP